MLLRAAIQRTIRLRVHRDTVSQSAHTDRHSVPEQLWWSEDVVDRLPEVRVRYVIDPAEDERRTCRLCNGAIYGSVCAAGTQCDYHFYCAAQVIHQTDKRRHLQRQRRREAEARQRELRRCLARNAWQPARENPSSRCLKLSCASGGESVVVATFRGTLLTTLAKASRIIRGWVARERQAVRTFPNRSMGGLGHIFCLGRFSRTIGEIARPLRQGVMSSMVSVGPMQRQCRPSELLAQSRRRHTEPPATPNQQRLKRRRATCTPGACAARHSARRRGAVLARWHAVRQQRAAWLWCASAPKTARVLRYAVSAWSKPDSDAPRKPGYRLASTCVGPWLTWRTLRSWSTCIAGRAVVSIGYSCLLASLRSRMPLPFAVIGAYCFSCFATRIFALEFRCPLSSKPLMPFASARSVQCLKTKSPLSKAICSNI